MRQPLQQVLPPDYVATSHNAKWGDCFVRALAACDRSLGLGMPSPAEVEVRACIRNGPPHISLMALPERRLYFEFPARKV